MDISKKVFLLTVALLSLIVIFGAYSINNNLPTKQFNMDLLTITNYTGLPEGIDVKIYPKDHIISGKTFKIVIENNRDKGLYWGAYWEAEKWVNGYWVYQKPPWGTWVNPLLYTDPHSVLIYDERAFFGPGVYRITKNFMLTDVYLCDEERWESEFTVQFVVVKTS